jgi:hypothetical protein
VNSPRAGSRVEAVSLGGVCASKGDENSPAVPSAAAPRIKPRLQISHILLPPGPGLSPISAFGLYCFSACPLSAFYTNWRP